MARIIRVRINWTGWQGGPGYTNLHFEPTVEEDPITQTLVDAAVTKVQTFLTVIRNSLSPAVITGVDAAVAELDEQSGAIEQWHNAIPAAPAPGLTSPTFAAATGFCINWQTGGVRNSRRVRGRTFIVPIATNMYETDGTLVAANLTAWRNAATALTGDENGIRLVVWVRPTQDLIPDGGAYNVTGMSINDKVAILTSRR